MRDDRRNYIVVGLFVVAMIAALLVWLAVVAGRTGTTDPYHIYYESVMGLSPGTQVYFEGYPVGLLGGITHESGEAGDRFRVDISVRGGWRIPADSVAEIAAPGLLAAVVLNVQAGESSEFLEPGGEIQGKEPANVMEVVSGVAEEFTRLVDDAKPVLESLTTGTPEIVAGLQQVTEQVNALLAPENVELIRTILVNLEATTTRADSLVTDLAHTKQQVDSVLDSVEGMLNSDQGELAHALQDLHHTLESVASQIDQITYNLDTTTRNMAEFSEQLRRNPGVLLRGREASEEPTP